MNPWNPSLSHFLRRRTLTPLLYSMLSGLLSHFRQLPMFLFSLKVWNTHFSQPKLPWLVNSDHIAYGVRHQLLHIFYSFIHKTPGSLHHFNSRRVLSLLLPQNRSSLNLAPNWSISKLIRVALFLSSRGKRFPTFQDRKQSKASLWLYCFALFKLSW